MEKNIPPQLTGEQKDIRQTRRAADKAEVTALFGFAVERLLDVNRWAEWSGAFSAAFQLTDDTGTPVQGKAKGGLLIRIDIMGPGTQTGHGYDWVQIERIMYEEDVQRDTEYQLITVRPCADPGKPKGVAHFFGRSATSTFIVARERLLVHAEVHGRNERTSHEGTFTDKLRNEIVSFASLSGLSDMQWNSLAKGLLGL